MSTPTALIVHRGTTTMKKLSTIVPIATRGSITLEPSRPTKPFVPQIGPVSRAEGLGRKNRMEIMSQRVCEKHFRRIDPPTMEALLENFLRSGERGNVSDCF